MSRKAIIAVVVLVVILGVVTSVSLVFWFSGRTDAQALKELDQKIKKWTHDRTRISKVLADLEKTWTATMKGLDDLKIKSEDDIKDNTMAQRLETERKKTNTRLWAFMQKTKSLDGAIFDAESKKKEVIEAGIAKKVMTAGELNKLIADLVSIDEGLDKSEPDDDQSAPEITLEQDMKAFKSSGKPLVMLSPTSNPEDGTTTHHNNSVPKPGPRKWTKADGTTFEAEFVSFEKGKGVTLRQPDGKTFMLVMSQLSEKDKKYVRKMGKSK